MNVFSGPNNLVTKVDDRRDLMSSRNDCELDSKAKSSTKTPMMMKSSPLRPN